MLVLFEITKRFNIMDQWWGSGLLDICSKFSLFANLSGRMKAKFELVFILEIGVKFESVKCLKIMFRISLFFSVINIRGKFEIVCDMEHLKSAGNLNNSIRVSQHFTAQFWHYNYQIPLKVTKLGKMVSLTIKFSSSIVFF